MAKMGRPTKYKPEFVKQVKKACEFGATDADLAALLGVSERTINLWRLTYPDFGAAMIVAKTVADDRVERSLYKRALGYEQEAVKIFMPAGAREPVYAPYTEKVAPDTTAAIFWLKNRRPDVWRDRHKLEHDVSEDSPLAALIGAINAKDSTLKPQDDQA